MFTYLTNRLLNCHNPTNIPKQPKTTLPPNHQRDWLQLELKLWNWHSHFVFFPYSPLACLHIITCIWSSLCSFYLLRLVHSHLSQTLGHKSVLYLTKLSEITYQKTATIVMCNSKSLVKWDPYGINMTTINLLIPTDILN